MIGALINASSIFLSKDATYYYRKNLTSTTENITPQHALDLSDSIKELYDLNNKNVNLLNVKFVNDVLFWVYYYDWPVNDEISVISKLQKCAFKISSEDLDYFEKLFPDYEAYYRQDCLNLNNYDAETFLAKYKYFKRLAKVKSVASLYVDEGEGFSENSKVSIEYAPQRRNRLIFDLKGFDDIVNIRFDPLEGDFIKSKINNIEVIDSNCNNSINDDYQIFLTLDPNYILNSNVNGELEIDFNLFLLNNDEIVNFFIEKDSIINEKDSIINEKDSIINEKDNIINEINQKNKKSRFNFLK